MAEVVIPIGYGNCIWRWTGPTGDVSISCGYVQRDGLYTPTDSADALMETMRETGAPGTAVNMLDAWVYRGTQVYEMRAGGLVGGEAPVSVAGTVVSAEAAVGWSVVASKSTGFLGRSRRGRCYFPPLSLANTDIKPNGTIDTAVALAIQDKVDVWFDAMVDTEYLPTLLHSNPAQDPDTITSFTVKEKLGFQRRRL